MPGVVGTDIAAELAARLRHAEFENAAILRIQRLDADLAENAAAKGAASDADKDEHERAVEAVLSALPSWKSATVIQQAFKASRARKQVGQAANREAEESARQDATDRAAMSDTPEDRAIIDNLSNREDLGYPAEAEVRDALKLARGTKARMPEVVRVLRRKKSAQNKPRSPYKSPVKSVRGLRMEDPVDVEDLPVVEAFMLLRDRLRAAPVVTPPTSPPAGEEIAPMASFTSPVRDDRLVQQLQKQIDDLRMEKDAQAKEASQLSSQLAQVNAQLSQNRLELSMAVAKAGRSAQIPGMPIAATTPARQEQTSNLREEWDAAAATIQAQYTRWRHMQDMRTLMDAAKRETTSLKAIVADRNSQLQAHGARIQLLDASHAQLTSQGAAHIQTIENLQQELSVLEDWQRGQHQFVADQELNHEDALDSHRAQHAAELQAERANQETMATEVEAMNDSVLAMHRAELENAAERMREMADSREQALESLRSEMESHKHEASTSAKNQDAVLDQVSLEAATFREHHADAVGKHQDAVAAHQADLESHSASLAHLQSEHDHHKALAAAHKDEVARLEAQVESTASSRAATHIQMEFQRMRAQQDLRQVSKLQVASSKHIDHLKGNASTTLQLHVARKQAQRDMRDLLAAHRSHVAAAAEKAEKLTSELAEATSDNLALQGSHKKKMVATIQEYEAEKDGMHDLTRKAVGELRIGHDDEMAKIQKTHEDTLRRKLEDMRSQHAQELDEREEATEDSIGDLLDELKKVKAAAAAAASVQVAAPSNDEIERKAREMVAVENQEILVGVRSELEELKAENNKWMELAYAVQVQKQQSNAAAPRAVDTASSPLPALTPSEPSTDVASSVEEALQTRLISMPEVQGARAKVVFRRYDADADGFLNLRELREMMAETGEPGYYMSQEEYEAMCKVLDCDHSQGVDLAKFVSMYTPPLCDKLGTDIAKDFAIVAGSWIFEMYDQDQDGHLNITEARQLQMDTVPEEGEISDEQFARLCSLLGCSTETGIDLDTFVTAYCAPLCDQLGWDVAKDFSLVAGQMIAQQYDIDALGIVVPGTSPGTVMNTQVGLERIRLLETELEVQQAQINEALAQREAVVREMEAAQSAAEAAKKQAAESAAAAQKSAAADPALLEELTKWQSLAANAKAPALQQAVSSVDSIVQSSEPSLAAEEEIQAWTAFAKSLADETVRTMNFLCVKNASVRAGPKLASSPIGKLEGGEIVRVISTEEIVDASVKVVRGHIMTMNFPDGWVTISKGEQVLFKRVWPAATVSQEQLREAGAVVEGSAGGTGDAVEVSELHDQILFLESERDDMKEALEQAEAVEAGVVAEAVAAMETAAQVATRCRERVAELQSVVDDKDRSIDEHRSARQRLEENLATVLNDVTAEAQGVEKLEKNCRVLLEAEKQRANVAIQEAKGMAVSAGEVAAAAIDEMAKLVQDDTNFQGVSAEGVPQVARLNFVPAEQVPANMPPIPRTPPTTAIGAVLDSAAAQRIRALQQAEEAELKGVPVSAPAAASDEPEMTEEEEAALAAKYLPKTASGARPVRPTDTYEQKVYDYLLPRNQADLTSCVCKAFHNEKYPPQTWVKELTDMQRNGDLDTFMKSVTSVVVEGKNAASGGAPPGMVTAEFAQVSGPLGIAWETKETFHPDGSGRIVTALMIKSMKAGLPAASGRYTPGRGLKDGLALAMVEGGTPGQQGHKRQAVMGLSFEQAIGRVRSASRPLKLELFPPTLAPAKSPRAGGSGMVEVQFVSPGPLGLTLSSITGNPKDPGVKLKAIKPTSPVYGRTHGLENGMRLVRLKNHSGSSVVPLRERPYADVIGELKKAGRPLTLYFEAATGDVVDASPRSRSASPAEGSMSPRSTPDRHVVTIEPAGTMGVMWKQVMVGNPRQGYPVVKAVKQESVGQKAGLQAFEILLAVNGRSVAEQTYEEVIAVLKSTRPLTLEMKKVR